MLIEIDMNYKTVNSTWFKYNSLYIVDKEHWSITLFHLHEDLSIIYWFN